jgi:hypothetical protein
MAKNLSARPTTNLAIITRPMLNLVASGLGLALISKTVKALNGTIKLPTNYSLLMFSITLLYGKSSVLH